MIHGGLHRPTSNHAYSLFLRAHFSQKWNSKTLQSLATYFIKYLVASAPRFSAPQQIISSARTGFHQSEFSLALPNWKNPPCVLTGILTLICVDEYIARSFKCTTYA